MIDMNKKYKTRCGLEVRLLCTDAQSSAPVTGLVKIKGEDSFMQWSINGSAQSNKVTDLLDLVEVKQKKEGWINIYYDSLHPSYIHKSKLLADNHASPNRVACIRIEWEE